MAWLSHACLVHGGILLLGRYIVGIFFFFFFAFLFFWSSKGPLVLRSPGPLVLWSPGPPVLLSSGPLVLWSSSSTSVLDNHNNNNNNNNNNNSNNNSNNNNNQVNTCNAFLAMSALGGRRCALPPNPPPAFFNFKVGPIARTNTPTQKHHHTNTKTPPHHHKNTTTPHKHNHKNTTTKTPPQGTPQKHHHTTTKTPPQKHHHKNTTTKTPPPKHHHKNTKTPPHHHKNTTQPHHVSWKESRHKAHRPKKKNAPKKRKKFPKQVRTLLLFRVVNAACLDPWCVQETTRKKFQKENIIFFDPYFIFVDPAAFQNMSFRAFKDPWLTLIFSAEAG